MAAREILERQFALYKELLTQYPSAIRYDLYNDDADNILRYHRAGEKVFRALIDKQGHFKGLIPDIKLH